MDKYIATTILKNYFKNQTYLNIALNEVFKSHQFSPNEKGRITTMVYGTIQNLLFLQYQLEPFLKKNPKPFEKALLLISLYEHYFLNVPDYAIVNESVKIAHRKSKYTASFINAILRKAFENKREIEGDKLTKLSLVTSSPLWLVKMLTKQYGFDITLKICQENNKVPYKTGRVNTLYLSRDEFLKAYPHYTKGQFALNSVYFDEGNIASTYEYQKGLVTVQDEASQKVAELLSPKEGSNVLDMCSAPGSKTTHLAQIMHNTGNIDAYDIYDHKISLIKQNCLRLNITNVHIQKLNALEIPNENKYDYILLDAPCSGLGVLSRKPEIKYHDSRVMDELIPLQEKLLEKAYLLLKNGGRMVYSTCSINKKENEKQIVHFIEKYPAMTILHEEVILPFMYHSDGFYMCLMEKSNGINL